MSNSLDVLLKYEALVVVLNDVKNNTAVSIHDGNDIFLQYDLVELTIHPDRSIRVGCLYFDDPECEISLDKFVEIIENSDNYKRQLRSDVYKNDL